MHYLKLRRTQLILGAFAVFALLFAEVPGIDLYVAGLSFKAGTFDHDKGWQIFLHYSLTYFLVASSLAIVGIYTYNLARRCKVLDVDGKRVLFVFLVLFLGAGLTVNVVLKDNFGRARPRDIVEFGGSKMFTPAFVVSHECRKNCSFSSGDAAAAFFAMALVRALSRRRALMLAAFAYGAIVSVGRIYSGAHFLSDTVVSFFVMLVIGDALYHFMLRSAADREGVSLADPGLKATYAADSH
ncbi:MAG: phosphatase PAP2 family protein [Steroidobacteraceae bacterium]